MRMHASLILFTLFVLSLSACSPAREMPLNEGDESDTMRLSPCVCNEVDFNSRGFKWVS